MAAKTLFVDENLPDRTRAIIELLLRAAVEAIGADGSSVMFLSADGQSLVMKGMAALEAGLASNVGISVKAGERVCGRVMLTGETVILTGDVQNTPQFSSVKKYQKIKSGLCAPMKARGKVIGVLNMKRIAMNTPLNHAETRFAEALAAVAAEMLA